tara:strand:+ start:1681 stop:2019 length:339 start_codon:yes stop_codon:yes gene_type:complete
METKTYVIDIDGTICTQCEGATTDYSDAYPIRQRIDAVNALYDQGNTIIYCTARGMGRTGGNQIASTSLFYQRTTEQLNEWGAKYHQLFLGKPAGDVYIDDKAVNANDYFKN